MTEKITTTLDLTGSPRRYEIIEAQAGKAVVRLDDFDGQREPAGFYHAAWEVSAEQIKTIYHHKSDGTVDIHTK